MQRSANILRILLFASFLVLVLQTACGYFQKDKKTPTATASDTRFPSGWDLLSDWTGGDWKIENL